MAQLFEFFGIKELSDVMNYRLILSLFCLLTFTLLFYFWNLSRKKSDTNKANATGLIFLSFAFLLYFIIGFASAYKPDKSVYPILSGLVSICFLLSMPFFSQGNSWFDRIIQHKTYNNVVIFFGFAWLITISLMKNSKLMYDLDIILASVSILLFGLYLGWTFIRKGLNFIGIITGLFTVFIIWLQVNSPELLGEGKFVHINSTILSPALFLSIISVAYTFNWINEQNFRELSKIYTSREEEENRSSKVSENTLPERWRKQIAKDNIERAIEEVMSFLKNKNRELDFILNIAQRNNRNNTTRLKDLINYEVYQRNRNQISEALIAIIDTKTH